METWSDSVGNLSPGAANKRVRNGIVALALGLLVAVLMDRIAVHWPWRLLVFVPFFAAGNGFLQGLYRS